MKKLSNQDYAQILFDATQGLSEADAKKVVQEFTVLLIRRRKIGSAEDIIRRFVMISEKKEGVVRVEVTTAHGVTEELPEQLGKVFGGKVKIAEKKDVSLFGGIIVKTAGMILDGSLKTQLIKLKSSLV